MGKIYCRVVNDQASHNIYITSITLNFSKQYLTLAQKPIINQQLRLPMFPDSMETISLIDLNLGFKTNSVALVQLYFELRYTKIYQICLSSQRYYMLTPRQILITLVQDANWSSVLVHSQLEILIMLPLGLWFIYSIKCTRY